MTKTEYDDLDDSTKTEIPYHKHPKANQTDIQNSSIRLRNLPGVILRKVFDDVLSNEKISLNKNTTFKRPACTDIETFQLGKRSKINSEIIFTGKIEDASQIQEHSNTGQQIEKNTNMT